MPARLLTFVSALFLVAVVAACEPTITGEFTLTVPYCPTSDSLYFAADSVPLGCPVPAIMGLRAGPLLVSGDGSWLRPAE